MLYTINNPLKIRQTLLSADGEFVSKEIAVALLDIAKHFKTFINQEAPEFYNTLGIQIDKAITNAEK